MAPNEITWQLRLTPMELAWLHQVIGAQPAGSVSSPLFIKLQNLVRQHNNFVDVNIPEGIHKQ